MSLRNLNPFYFDADEEELIKYLCPPFLVKEGGKYDCDVSYRQFYPPHVITCFADFHSCHIQDHTVRYLIRIHFFYDEEGYLSII